MPERIRPTKVGVWYIVATLLVGIAATNTGNNALYLVLALLLGLLVVSGWVSRRNLHLLDCELAAPREVFANRPFHLRLVVASRARLVPRWLLVFSVADQGQPLLVPYLPAGGTSRGPLELMLSRRGVHRFDSLHVGSIFPLGLFHKGLRYWADVEVLVYPEIFAAAVGQPAQLGRRGLGQARRAGWGHELHSLRPYRAGDDPRRIHWKQSARTQELVYTVREAERGNRLSIVFDNAVGTLSGEAVNRFERLVSEAATAAVDALGRGLEVELVTRDVHLPYAGGLRQRHEILRALALVEARPIEATALPQRLGAPQLRLSLERERVEVA